MHVAFRSVPYSAPFCVTSPEHAPVWQLIYVDVHLNSTRAIRQNGTDAQGVNPRTEGIEYLPAQTIWTGRQPSLYSRIKYALMLIKLSRVVLS